MKDFISIHSSFGSSSCELCCEREFDKSYCHSPSVGHRLCVDLKFPTSAAGCQQSCLHRMDGKKRASSCTVPELFQSSSSHICACILLCLLVRGFDGTIWMALHCIELRHLLATDLASFVRHVIRNHRKESLFHARHTWAAHIENRHTAQSGLHPILALLNAHNRRLFVAVSGFLCVSCYVSVLDWCSWHCCLRTFVS